ncbi:carboxypeptidase-like regulatory domain-containing protein [Myxococcus hansupus]|nr:carboxypeptidase-like regulatory domain-containing protein [Myxococcus hansupus]
MSVLGLIAWDAYSTTGAVERGVEFAASSHATNRLQGAVSPGTVALHPVARPDRRRRIRGTVVDTRGAPLAGVHVSAMSRADESLAELPCPDWAPGAWEALLEEKPRRLLQDCQWAGRDALTEWLSSRRGEAIPQAETVTDGDGAYLLDGLDDGALSIWALNEEGAAAQQDILGIHDDLRLVLTPGLRVEGIVSGGGAPLPGTHLTLVSVTTGRYFDGIAGPDGRFRMGPLPLGRYVLLAEQGGWRPALLHLDEATSLPEDGVRLTRPLNHAGRVLSRGNPISGARVELFVDFSSEEGSLQVATSDAKGQFHFSGLREGHRVTLSAFHEGMIASAQVTLDERDGAETELELRPAPFLEGVVRDEARQSISGANISWVPQRLGGIYPATTTTLDGRFRLGPLGPDKNQITVSAPGYLDAHFYLDSLELQSPFDITLFRAELITGVAVDEHGAPAPNVTLKLNRACKHPASFGERPQTTTDTAGRFELKACSPGPWEMEAVDERFLPDAIPVHAPSGGLRIALKQGPTVTGILLDEHGVPVVGADVFLAKREERGSPSRYISSDAQGHFRLGAVPPGHYIVWAQKHVQGVTRLTAAQDLELRDGMATQVELRFPVGLTVSGIVVTASGTPLEGVAIQTSRFPQADSTEPPHIGFGCGGPPIGVRTDASGRFVLRGLSSAPHAVWATKDGHAFKPARSMGGTHHDNDWIFMKPGASENDLRLVLQRISFVRGRLLGPDGRPFPDYVINREIGVFSLEGTFLFPTTNHGQMALIFDAPGVASRTVTVDVPLEEDVDLGDIHMPTVLHP